MLYDIRLHLHYDYAAAAGGSRHHVHVAPQTISGVQRVVASSLSFSPTPTERSDFLDFFGNAVTSIALRGSYEALDVRMSARVSVERPEPGLDVSPEIADLGGEISAVRSLSPQAPHHFIAASDHVDLDAGITAYARESLVRDSSVTGVATDFCNRIYNDFAYDGEATTVATKAADAFALRRGVCQDFTHVMIAGLRGLGIPAGYVRGFLRTIPPAGKERLEGADAMHAWVRAWCGQHMGWVEFDPTNAMIAGPDHICIGHGRDYADISPIVGVLKTHGSHETRQSVDVLRVE